jgi:hypothetical protein
MWEKISLKGFPGPDDLATALLDQILNILNAEEHLLYVLNANNTNKFPLTALVVTCL